MFYSRYCINSELIISLNTMRTIKTITVLALAVFLISSCVRKNETITPVEPQGGIGGNATIVVHPQYHDRDLSDAIVYIRYASTEYAASIDLYDDLDTATIINGRPGVAFDSLKQGSYYIYAVGTNDSLGSERFNTYGGAPFVIVDTLERTYELNLHITNGYLEYVKGQE